jgi:uncharacterized protein (TIGR02145 family)
MKKKNRNLFCILVLLGYMLTFLNCANKPRNIVTDIDGNVYHTITIGTQVWMVENLKTTKYRNGDLICNVTDNAVWVSFTTGAYCNYNNDTNNSASYGMLYNWYAISDRRNIAPIGYHVPSDSEWTTLITYLGGESIAGGKLKEKDTTHWKNPNTGATNKTEFTALPGGCRNIGGPFSSVGINGMWLSSTEGDASNGWIRCMEYGDSGAYRYYGSKGGGFSVRCIRD